MPLFRIRKPAQFSNFCIELYLVYDLEFLTDVNQILCDLLTGWVKCSPVLFPGKRKRIKKGRSERIDPGFSKATKQKRRREAWL